MKVKGQNVHFKQFDNKTGPSHFSIRSLLYDREGFLWLGTRGGLNRYDGLNFKVYVTDPADSTSISNNVIQALHEDSLGNIWVGTGSGHLNLLNKKTDKFSRFNLLTSEFQDSSASISSLSISAITEDLGGNFWIGTSEGLFRLENPYSHNGNKIGNPICKKVNETPVTDILTDQEGLIWLAEENGSVGYVNPSSDIIHNPEFKINVVYFDTEYPVYTLSSDHNSELLMGTSNGYVFKVNGYDFNNIEFVSYEENNGRIKSLLHDRRGNFWIGTATNGLHRIDTKTGNKQIFNPDPSSNHSLSNMNIEAIVEDDFDNIWIGTWGGLNKINQNALYFNSILPNEIEDGLYNSDRILSILEYQPNTFLLGTQGGGLLSYSLITHSLKPFRTEFAGLDSTQVNSIIKDNQENIWIAYYEKGVLRYNLQNHNRHLFQNDPEIRNSLSDNKVTAVFMDSRDRIWVGTFKGGLNRYVPETNSFVQYMPDPLNANSISGNSVTTIFEDSSGILWIGTQYAGLNRFNEATNNFSRFSLLPTDSIKTSNSTVFTISQAKNGNLWLGLEEEGLLELDPSSHSIVRYGTEEGLPDNSVLSIEIDDDNTFWLGTENGLSHFDPEKKLFTNYSEEHGLQGAVFHANSSLRTSDGKLIFGGENGFTYFNPSSIVTTDKQPPLILVDFKIKNEPDTSGIAPTAIDSIVLEYDQNFLTFTFAALDFTDPGQMHYRYMLENYDDGWIEKHDETQRFANYTKVGPGDYVLRAQATKRSGLWNEPGLTIPIKINPPFWETWWFQSAVALFVAGLIFGAHQYRLTKQQQIHDTRVQGMKDMEKLRMRIAGQLHDRVSANLSTIGLVAESLTFQRGEGPKEKENLEKITRLARDSANSIRETSWVVNTGFDRLDKLVSAMEDVGYDMLGDAIALDFERLNNIPDIPITMDFRQNVYYFFREALHNIVKHAGAQMVEVTVSNGQDRFELTIKDDGKGFDQKDVHESNGMVLFRRRARDLKGAVSIDTAPGQGTSIRLTAPVDKPDIQLS